MQKQPSVHFVSLGCPKNRVDTEVMLGQALGRGHEVLPDAEGADVIVVNTCGFIGEAKQESIDTILEMARYKEAGSCKKLIVTGCLSQRYSAELAAELPEVDKLFGSGEVEKVAAALNLDAVDAAARIDVAEAPHYLYNARTERELAGPSFSTYVKIAEGCDRPCAFCIIPKLRGAQRSRSIEDICTEAAELGRRGTREINLIAQDLTRYGDDLPDRPTLAALLKALGRVDGIRWVRLHYTYPSAFSDELIEVIAGEAKVVPYVDVPIQHIDDRVLKKMRRGYGARVVHDLVERLRARIPGVVLRTTFITGHPGEDEAAFARLCAFVEDAKFERVGVFPYSREEGTVAYELGDEVPEEEAQARRRELMRLQRRISRAQQAELVGQELEVLVEGVSDESEYLLQGRWAGQAPEIDGTVYLADGAARAGDFVRAKVTSFADYDLAASIVEVSDPRPTGAGTRLPVLG